MLVPDLHALGNGILMGTGEGCKYKSSAVGASHIDVHAGVLLVLCRNLRHIGEIQLRINALGIHIHGQCHDIHVTSTLAVSKKGSLDTISACKNSHLGIADAAAAVVVGMQGNDNVVSVFQVFAHILYLAGINVRHGVLHGAGQVDDDFMIRGWLPYVQNGIADLQSVLHLCTGEALRAVLEGIVSVGLLGQFFQKLCAVHSDFQDLFFRFFEYLLTLSHGSGIVYMNNGFLHALKSLKGFPDDVLSGLGQYLDGHIVGDHIFLNQGS